jgi:hypothetical protein
MDSHRETSKPGVLLPNGSLSSGGDQAGMDLIQLSAGDAAEPRAGALIASRAGIEEACCARAA